MKTIGFWIVGVTCLIAYMASTVESKSHLARTWKETEVQFVTSELTRSRREAAEEKPEEKTEKKDEESEGSGDYYDENEEEESSEDEKKDEEKKEEKGKETSCAIC